MSELKSLGEQRLRDCDPAIIKQQIAMWTRVDINARDYVGMPDGLMFTFGKTTPKRLHKVIIKLNDGDLYEVEFGYLNRKTLEWIVVQQVSNVYNDSLSEVVRLMVARSLEL